MNIFILDNNIQSNAQALCDKHVVKMILETAQLLCSQYSKGTAPYRQTHLNHPCSVWARQSIQNYEWLISYGEELCKEFTYRFKKTHASEKVIQWCKSNRSTLSLANIGLTPFVQAMPSQYRQQDAVSAYREYYKNEKRDIAKWHHNRSQPIWF